MSICLDYATYLGAFVDKEGGLHWPSADASNFDISRLKFCPECGQLLLQEDGTPVIGPVTKTEERPNTQARK